MDIEKELIDPPVHGVFTGDLSLNAGIVYTRPGTVDTVNRQMLEALNAFRKAVNGVNLDDHPELKEAYQLATTAIVDVEEKKQLSIPEQLEPTGREGWTVGEWCEHFGGRHRNNDPLNYYEFGSVQAIAALLRSHARTAYRSGWNDHRTALTHPEGIKGLLDQQQHPIKR